MEALLILGRLTETLRMEVMALHGRLMETLRMEIILILVLVKHVGFMVIRHTVTKTF